MAASYPTSIVVLSTKNDGDTIFASHVDAIQDETIAVETGLLNGFQHIIKPFSDNTYDLGTSALNWRDAFVKRNLTHNGFLGVGALLVSNASKQIVEQAALTNGQVMIGSTGAAPVAATLTAGTGISVTNAAGTITIANTATGSVSILDKSTTEQDVTNTGVATDVYSYALPGGKLGTNGVVRLTATGDIDQTSGGPINITIAVSYGGTTIAGTAAQFTINSGTGKAVWKVVLHLNANGATNSQRAIAEVFVPAPGSAYANGAAQFSAAAGLSWAVHDALAIDSTVNQNLKVTVTWASAAVNAHFRRWTAMTELL